MGILKFKKVNCKNCYKCIRYCPVKAIEIKDHHAQIIDNDCILCGNCTVVCPQNAKEDNDDVPIIKKLIREGKNVIATIAPSYIANFEVNNYKMIKGCLVKLGFSDVFETAEGAYLVKTEYERLVEKKWNSIIISSACPSVVKYIQRYKPELLQFLSPVISPMEASAKLIKEKYTDAVVVFIGPCISKKLECSYDNANTDYVITYDELKKWLVESNLYDMLKINNKDNILINYNNVENENNTNNEMCYEECHNTNIKYKSRLFPIKGGIIDTMKKDKNYKYIAIDGLDSCFTAIKEIENGLVNNCFIEMSACKGSCIGGPHFRKNNLSVINSEIRVKENALNNQIDSLNSVDYDINCDFSLENHIKSKEVVYAQPSEKQILTILKKMGKNSEEDELNCGTCGYSTCREKAIAVFYKKAEISMCLPFMKERAESFSDKIINLTPNAVVAIDMDLNVQQINKSACEIFGINSEKDIKGYPVSRILDEIDFVNIITSGKTKLKKNTFLVEYNLYLEQLFLYDKVNNIVICIMHDITNDRRRRNKIRDEKLRAANMADNIVEKQLRIVHEIASLLGETAAETKIAVNDLKDKILLEDNDS